MKSDGDRVGWREKLAPQAFSTDFANRIQA
jgi:hypothetical protein